MSAGATSLSILMPSTFASVAFETVPHQRLRATPTGQCVTGSCEARPLRSPAFVARADFIKVGHSAPFSQFLHIKGENFLDVFSLHICLWPLWTMKFHGNRSARFGEIWKTDRDHTHTHTHRQTRLLYTYIDNHGFIFFWTQCNIWQTVRHSHERLQINCQCFHTQRHKWKTSILTIPPLLNLNSSCILLGCKQY